MKSSCKLGLIFGIILVLIMPIYCADNIPLTDTEIQHMAPDTVGLLNGGIKIVEIKQTDYKDKEFIEFDTEVIFFNTKSEPILLTLVVEPFYEEREHIIKPNYIYYFLPNLNWISLPSQVTVESFNKYIVPVHIKMPTAEAFEKAKDGGYICMIAGYWGSDMIGISASNKLFITMVEGTDTTVPIVYGIYMLPILVGSLIAFAYLYFRFRKKIIGEYENKK